MSEVMVDGIDVSGCPEYCKYREGYCGWHVPCDVEGSCQYKINWLKQQIEAYKQSEQEAGEIIAELKHENEQLKDVTCEAIIEQERLIKEVNELRQESEKYKPFYEIGAKCTQLKEVADNLNNLNSKYKRALEEIMKIAEPYSKFSSYTSVCGYEDIIKKVREVLK